jgi:Protein of unknown function (DUF1592)/Protein of unknown function (DUF1588)/Protein of unknown function (DUF1585)/Protein of unknown function (DUF1587)/Protein of unknown function (DUF1595)
MRRIGRRVDPPIFLVLLAFFLVPLVFCSPSFGQSPTAEYRELVNRYCVTCHNQRAKIPAGAPLYLDTANLNDPAADAAVWEKVIWKLGVGAMPPQGAPSPEHAKLTEFRTWLMTTLDRAATEHSNPGRYVLHRLNRVEYANAIRDLLAVDIDVTGLLPSDGGGDFGFDNVAAALKTSPLLLERYLTAALYISDLAVGNPDVTPGATTFTIGFEVTQDQRMEGLPLGTRGGTLVQHNFPADAEYVLSGRLLNTVAEGYVGVEGHEVPHQFVITIDGEQVYSAPIGGKADHDLSSKDILQSRVEIDKRMTARVPVTAGPHEVGFTWIEKPTREQAVWQPSQRASQEVHNPGGMPRLRTVSIEGPYNVTGISNTASRKRLFVCHPASVRSTDETACARRIFSTVARRAFRRPVNQQDLEAPMAFYADALKSGGFEAGIRAGLARILASPSFVFRAEIDPASLPAGAAHRISDLELASRLSFFLWNSIPDDELLNLAIAGRLHEPGVLQAQVQRMVADARVDSMVSNFTGQWLQLRNLQLVKPDLLLFPDFDDNLRQAFRHETELFFANIMRENRSALDLLNADYTFVNERLARHYGIAGVYGDRFRRVTLTDANRRGLLGQASILSLTSVATRTSPTIRGKYIVSNFLNTPPLPPPPVVPPLDKSVPADRPSTIREQLELHRSNAVCASCHRNIDPVGFALENFDAVGQWRDTTKEGLKIDSSGVLADGTSVNGPIELRKALLARPEVFVGTVAEKLLIYALGRGLEPSDMPVVRRIVKQAAAENYGFMSIILGIVESPPFQMRTKFVESNTVAEVREAQARQRAALSDDRRRGARRAPLQNHK